MTSLEASLTGSLEEDFDFFSSLRTYMKGRARNFSNFRAYILLRSVFFPRALYRGGREELGIFTSLTACM